MTIKLSRRSTAVSWFTSVTTPTVNPQLISCSDQLLIVNGAITEAELGTDFATVIYLHSTVQHQLTSKDVLMYNNKPGE